MGNAALRIVGVVTVGRTDWSIWLPVLHELRRHPGLAVRLYATGMHLSPEFGTTIREVQEAGFEIAERIEIILSSDSPQGVAKAIGLGVLGFAQVFDHSRPDILLVMGDRFETLATVAAAMPFKIPVAHLHGGESTEGLIDELMRHAITKMSHIHFATTDLYAERIRRMGEEPWRVFVTGAPGIDAIKQTKPLSRSEFCNKYGLDSDQPFLLVTYHPVTLEFEDTALQVSRLLQALDRFKEQLVLTYPNADTAGRMVMELLRDYVASRSSAKLLINMGPLGYISAMQHAAAMVGNSSSGIIEAASLKLPVVNIGNRQRGRLKPVNVIDVGYTAAGIVAGIQQALSFEFRKGLQELVNPYGDGDASHKIAKVLGEIELGQQLISKSFVA